MNIETKAVTYYALWRIFLLTLNLFGNV